ncbi:MAG: BA14K family protein [Rhizobiales bacterium]|nr:BA14K family protein [Hyphomicrobiales bacterium]
MARKSLIAALAVVTAGAIALPSLSFAGPLAQPNLPTQVSKGDVNIEPVAQYWRKKKPGYGNYAYNKRWHGERYRYRHGAYNHYHNGWYYNSPWWVAGPIIGGALVGAYAAPRVYYDDGYGDGHVQYCFNRYRSYDPRSNTFLGYDGYRHECVSPY